MSLLELLASQPVHFLIGAPAQKEKIGVDGNGRTPQLESIDVDLRP